MSELKILPSLEGSTCRLITDHANLEPSGLASWCASLERECTWTAVITDAAEWMKVPTTHFLLNDVHA